MTVKQTTLHGSRWEISYLRTGTSYMYLHCSTLYSAQYRGQVKTLSPTLSATHSFFRALPSRKKSQSGAGLRHEYM